jgi:enoyl-CoA hydratase
VLRVTKNEFVSLLEIDRPSRRNAVDLDTISAISDALDDAVRGHVRAVVLAGAGGNFSAGADLAGVDGDGFTSALRSMLAKLRDSPLITIAAIDGFCLGAGLQMAGSCDLRVVADSARIGIPAAKIGIAVDQWTAALLVELVGASTARLLLLGAEPVDAVTAERVGLASRRGDRAAALAWASDLAELAPLTIAAHKAALGRVAHEIRGADDPVVAAAVGVAWASRDAIEGRAAFAEKRRPVFTGT